jgi:hypothetical protein
VDAALLGEELDLGPLVVQDVRAQMCKDEVEHHEPRLDVRIALDAAVLRIGAPYRSIDWLGDQVINMPPLSALDHAQMMKPGRLFNEARGHRPAVAARELAVLPAQKIAGMDSDQVEEHRFAIQIANGFKR